MKGQFQMKNEEVTLEVSFETLAVLARTDATSERRAEDALDLENVRGSSTCTHIGCCP